MKPKTVAFARVLSEQERLVIDAPTNTHKLRLNLSTIRKAPFQTALEEAEAIEARVNVWKIQSRSWMTTMAMKTHRGKVNRGRRIKDKCTHKYLRLNLPALISDGLKAASFLRERAINQLLTTK